MKLVIQIPARNEAEALPVALAALPRTLSGVDTVCWLVIDDGSTDGTADVARVHGVDHVVRLPEHRGLAAAFRAGLDAALDLGADVIVNTDADNQYDARDLPALIAPILAGEADLVVGARPITQLAQFSATKKLLQRLGSWTVRRASGTAVPDAPSGFRALTRAAAQRLNVFTPYTYTLETLIQAGRKGLVVRSVPVRVNPTTRPSRLVRGNLDYVVRSVGTIIHLLLLYRPRVLTTGPGLAAMTLGTALGLRFVAHAAVGDGGGHVQSLILAAILLLAGVVLVLVGLLAEILASHRLLLEDIQSRVRRMERG